jgi:erythromycin esterase-like protein
MWRNCDVVGFVEWRRARNNAHAHQVAGPRPSTVAAAHSAFTVMLAPANCASPHPPES